MSEENETLIRVSNFTKRFLQENSNIVFRADKDNVMISLDKEIYLKKITNMFSNEHLFGFK